MELTAYSSDDYKAGASGSEIARRLGAIQKTELSKLTELVLLRDDIVPYCRLSAGDNPLAIVDSFKAFTAAKNVLADRPDSQHFYSLVSRAGAAGEASRIHDVRSFVELEGQKYQVFELATDLLQLWELFIRNHTTLELDEFSRSMQSTLLGRVTDTVFYEAIARQLTPISAPAPVNASIEVLEDEIKNRLDRVAFYFEERELLRPGLSKYTVKSIGEGKDENAKRDVKRIRSAEISLLLELVHLKDSVDKWLEKQGRKAEQAVVSKFRPYDISRELANRYKHGMKGRDHNSAVIEFDYMMCAREGDAPTVDDHLLDVQGVVNIDGELFLLSQLIEDTLQLWQLFLRHHSHLPLTDFQARLGKVLLSRKGLTTYSAPIPDGIRAYAKEQSDQRKRLDLK